MELYDAPGHIAQSDPNRFATYASMDAFIVCFSLNDRYTFDDARTRWWEETKYINPAASTKKATDGRKIYQIIMLVGTKLDLAEHKAQYPEGLHELVTLRREANDFSKLLHAERFIECSARVIFCQIMLHQEWSSLLDYLSRTLTNLMILFSILFFVFASWRSPRAQLTRLKIRLPTPPITSNRSLD